MTDKNSFINIIMLILLWGCDSSNPDDPESFTAFEKNVVNTYGIEIDTIQAFCASEVAECYINDEGQPEVSLKHYARAGCSSTGGVITDHSYVIWNLNEAVISFNLSNEFVGCYGNDMTYDSHLFSNESSYVTIYEEDGENIQHEIPYPALVEDLPPSEDIYTDYDWGYSDDIVGGGNVNVTSNYFVLKTSYNFSPEIIEPSIFIKALWEYNDESYISFVFDNVTINYQASDSVTDHFYGSIKFPKKDLTSQFIDKTFN